MHRPDIVERTAAPGARKILRRSGSVEMWQIEPRSPSQRGRVIRYFVGARDGDIRSFDRPHQAWEYFQQITGVPAEPPDLPPEIPESMQRRRPRTRARRGAPAAAMRR